MLYNGKITLFEFTLLEDPLQKRKVMIQNYYHSLLSI